MNELLLVIQLAGRRAALPAIEVNAVVELAEVTPVPRAAAHVVGLAALIGLIVAVLQAATQVQDVTLAHLPRLVVVAVALALLGPWMGAEIAAFATRAWIGG